MRGYLGRARYFDYRKDDAGLAVKAQSILFNEVGNILQSNGAALVPYADRINNTFPFRHGGCCERVTQAVKSL